MPPHHHIELFHQEWFAGIPLLRCRPIRRRSTAHCRRNVDSGQNQPIFTIGTLRLICESGSIQGPVQPFAGAVASEHPPSPVRSMGSRSQPEDKDASLLISEARHRPPPVILFPKRGALVLGNLLAPLYKTRALPTVGDSLINISQGRGALFDRSVVAIQLFRRLLAGCPIGPLLSPTYVSIVLHTSQGRG